MKLSRMYDKNPNIEFVSYAISKLEKKKANLVFSNEYYIFLQYFTEYLMQKKVRTTIFYNFQKEMDLDQQFLLADTLWEQISEGPSLICP